ncbi:GTP-binding protein [Eubacteriaceae bacterium ES3]|nr:GTP-binding protein [Eubacteriaceae bacterium ES3]
MKLILLTGFLGSGKTTLLTNLLEEYKDRKIGVLMNEFGDVGVDGKLIENDDFKLTEINNGSIFCACLKENFILGLAEFLKYDLEMVFVESSGVSDPSNMGEVLNVVEKLAKTTYQYLGSICIADSLFFSKQYELIPALHKQIYYADVVVLNKVDLQSADLILETKKAIREINQDATIIETSYCKFPIDEQISKMEAAHIEKAWTESGNTVESRLVTKVLTTDSEIQYEALKTFLDLVAGNTYRIKGFAKTDKGIFEVSGVDQRIELISWPKPIEKTEIVMISSIGIGIISKVTSCWKEMMEAIKMKII